MLKKLLLSVIVIAALTSCKSDAGYKYSQYFVDKEKSLVPEVNSTEEQVGRYAGSLQYDSIRIVSAALEKKFDVAIDEMRQKPAPDAKGGELFKSEALKYFEYMRSIYTAYKDFGAATDEDREGVRARFLEIIQKKESVIENVKAAQRDFAAANGFKIGKE